jgi:hypothetical protein
MVKQRITPKGDGLTPRQRRVIEFLLIEPCITASAKKAGVHRATIHKWLLDPAFASALAKARRQAFERLLDQVPAALTSAISLLRSVVEDPVADAGLRVRAAGLLLNLMARGEDLMELTERLGAIETRLTELAEGAHYGPEKTDHYIRATA